MNVASNYLLQSPKGTTTEDSGAMMVSLESLARFGGGNPAIGRKELRSLLAMERDSPVHSGPTKRPESVRIAVPADEQDVLDLLMLDLEENAAHIAEIDKGKVLEMIRSGTRLRGGFVGVIGKPVIAAVILVPYQWWFSNGWYFQEIVNFVHPDHRRSHHADHLLDFAKWASDEQSKGFGYRVWLLCGVLGSWRVHAKTALYRRKFFQVGSAFLYPPPPIKRG